jgi:hypothetical protein
MCVAMTTHVHNPINRPIVLVPARMASTRLPGKPLADIGGAPMIVHVWQRATQADVGPVVVACAEFEPASRATGPRGGRARKSVKGGPKSSGAARGKSKAGKQTRR